MTETLREILAGLGLAQYFGTFLEQGFDSWETILDITESDLDALGVRLGHRRKLQRRIADARGISPNSILPPPARQTGQEPDPGLPNGFHGETSSEVVVKKRKYRRHPKPDKNAPERPPSAYVLFSNKIREDLKGRNLSFTEIAKIVGENWQVIPRQEREQFERRAQRSKERYCRELAAYKGTDEYRKYAQYLADFKKKQQANHQVKDAGKRPRSGSASNPGRSGHRHHGSVSGVVATAASSCGSEASGGWSEAHSLSGGEHSPPGRARRTQSIDSVNALAENPAEAARYPAGDVRAAETELSPLSASRAGGSGDNLALPPLSDVLDHRAFSAAPDMCGLGVYTGRRGSCQLQQPGACDRPAGLFINTGVGVMQPAAAGSPVSCRGYYGMSESPRDATLPIQSLLSGN